MLANDFYTIENKNVENENRFSYRIKFNCEHKIFAAHFPDQPIVPGACLLEICKELLSDFYNKQLIINKVNSIKFINTINPNVFSKIDFLFEQKLATNKLNISISAGEQNFVKISLPIANN